VIDRPDRFGVAVRGGLAADKALLVHEGEFTLDHDHLGCGETRGERIEAGLAQRFGQGVHAARGVPRQPRRQALGARDQPHEGDHLGIVIQAGARIALPQPVQQRLPQCV
jgi:hypothetical protein